MRYLLLLLLVLSTGLVACGKKNGKPSISTTNRERAAGPDIGTRNHLSPTDGSAWGEITGTPQNAFQEAAEGLIESIMDSQYVGYISGNSGDNTGIRFWGDVSTGGALTTNMPSTSVNSGSMRLVIWDEHAGKTDSSSGEVIPEIPFYFNSVSGTVQGNQAQLIFRQSDGYTTVEMVGYFDAENFVGVFRYQNLTSFDNSTPWRGELGNFAVRTCQFFRCN